MRAFGAVGHDVLAAVAARASRSLHVPCTVGPPLDASGVGEVAGRDQWDADRLLACAESAAARDPSAPDAVLAALSARDIGNPVFTHFFGRARLGGRALVVSLARLSPVFHGLPPDREALVRRAAAEVLHELGHVAGLRHCAAAACLMRLARDVDAIDLRGTRFCGPCAAAMPALVRVRAWEADGGS